MSQKMISRRDAFSFFGLAAALGFAVPTTALTTSDAKAQAQQTAPATTTPAPRASRQTHPYYHHHYYNYYGGGGWNTASGCPPDWTVQGGVCKPYRHGPWDIYGGRQSDYGY